MEEYEKRGQGGANPRRLAIPREAVGPTQRKRRMQLHAQESGRLGRQRPNSHHCWLVYRAGIFEDD